MSPRVLIYILRRDLRLADNPILHELSRLHTQSQRPFTHVLPIYIFPAQQVEVSGFLAPNTKSPYPEARSAVGKFWRCGHHRARFLAESVWDLKKALEGAGSGLEIRVGMVGEVVRGVLAGFEERGVEVAGLWMTDEEGVEEKREVRAVRKELEARGAAFRLWRDEKYYVDDRDVPFKDPQQLPDVFTAYRKQVEPLRAAPRRVLPAPTTLPPLPPSIPPQHAPFEIPTTLPALIAALHKPLSPTLDLQTPPTPPSSPAATTAAPFTGGASTGQARLHHLLKSGAMSTYKDTRNGLLGADFSTKFSAWLALGCITARQIHWAMVAFEDGEGEEYKGSRGFGKGENKGTAAVRFELLWRDYFRLCTRKYGARLFRASGCSGDESVDWGYDGEKLRRFLEGRTGMGMVDASQRELFLTGYTSNRTRQNVASYLAKRLRLDWRLGAEWYECCLIDHDVSSNSLNWMYNAGVGNDPREGGMGRLFNQVKQSYDYDPKAEYVKTWVDEVKDVEDPKDAFQYGENPLVRIEYNHRGGGGGKRGGGGGGHWGERGGRGRGGRGRGMPMRDR